MNPETTPGADRAKIVEPLKGKRFTPKDPKHFARGEAFEVIEDLDYAFVSGKKKEPAVRVRRVKSGAGSLQRRCVFLKDFEPLKTETPAQ